MNPLAVHLGDGWHVVHSGGPNQVSATACAKRFFWHDERSSFPVRTAPVSEDLWKYGEPGKHICGCYWYFRQETDE